MLVDIRYHLSSLVAVFLSLGLGIVIGMSLAEDDTLLREQQNLIRSIQTQVATVQERNAALQSELDRLSAAMGEYEARLFEMGRHHFGELLAGLTVGVIDAGDSDGEGIVEMLREYGLTPRYAAWPWSTDGDPPPGGEAGSTAGFNPFDVQVLVVAASRPEEQLLLLVEEAAARGIPVLFAHPAEAKAAEREEWSRRGGVVVESVGGLVGRLNLLQAIADLRSAAGEALDPRLSEAGGAE